MTNQKDCLHSHCFQTFPFLLVHTTAQSWSFTTKTRRALFPNSLRFRRSKNSGVVWTADANVAAVMGFKTNTFFNVDVA